MSKARISEQIDHDAIMMSFSFISQVELYMQKNKMNRADLAEILGTSKSYLTQLWRGDKLLNMKMIARIQLALKIRFKIKQTTTP